MDSSEYKKMESDPKNWVLGIVYFNRKDHRIFLSKRIKWLGFTLNFANPKAYFVVVGVGMLIYLLAQLKN
jgi:uncharacterized membrane protein